MNHMKTITENNLTWIDIERPAQKDFDWLKSTFNIHDIIFKEIALHSRREKVEYFDSYVFMVMYAPVFYQKKKTTAPIELDVIITKDHLITIHNETIEPLKDLIKKCQTKPDLKSKYFTSTTGHLFYWIGEEIVHFAERQLAHIGKNINQIEDDMFKGMERELISEISIVKRNILDFRTAIRPLNRIFNSLLNRGANFWPEQSEDLKAHFSDLDGDYERVWGEVGNYTETINALEDTHTNLLSNKTNATIRTFTILSFITFPAMLAASILQTSRENLWVIAIVILSTTTFMWLYFKFRK